MEFPLNCIYNIDSMGLGRQAWQIFYFSTCFKLSPTWSSGSPVQTRYLKETCRQRKLQDLAASRLPETIDSANDINEYAKF